MSHQRRPRVRPPLGRLVSPQPVSAKGWAQALIAATTDLDDTFERLQAGGAEVVQEPTKQPYGVRDCAFRDPAGNLIRINELS